jgi:KDPG and KHG aldolase
MSRVEDALGRSRVLPVVAVDDAAVVEDLCAALLEGGIACIEITFRTDAAAAAIERAAGVDGMLVGAGTVLTVEQAHLPARASPSRRGRTTRSSARAPRLGCRSSRGLRRPRSFRTRDGSVARP